jgi:hypothetical protein
VLVVVRAQVRVHHLRHAAAMWPLTLFVVFYVGYLVGTASIVAFAPIKTRFLIGVYVPLVVLGAWFFERASRRLPTTWRTPFTALVLAWVACNLVWFGARSFESARDGAGGYSRTEWHESRLMADVDAIDPALPIITNDAKAIELFTDRQAIESVALTFVGSNEPARSLAPFIGQIKCERQVALVWFSRPGTRGRLYSPEQLARRLRLEPVVTRRDGVIYDVTPFSTDVGLGASCTGLPERGDPEADVEG